MIGDDNDCTYIGRTAQARIGNRKSRFVLWTQLTPGSFDHLDGAVGDTPTQWLKAGRGDGRQCLIDGILNQDALGLEKVYVQGKRHTNSQVGEPDIRNFSGSLVKHGATKGVFITTSTFSPTARQTAKTIALGNQFIRLIAGQELAELMIKHDVGVVTEVRYEIKKLDANYFTDF